MSIVCCEKCGARTDYCTCEEEEHGCQHPNMEQTARTDYCPDCGYSFYYPSAY